MRVKSRLVWLAIGVLALTGTASVFAQDHELTISDACIAIEPHPSAKNGDDQDDPRGQEHALVKAIVSPELPGSTLRLYWRRLDLLVEDFYYTFMFPEGGGSYWGVLPDPEDHKLVRQELNDGTQTDTEFADFWKAKEASSSDPLDRDPNNNLDRDVIEERAALGSREKRTWMDGMSNDELEEFLGSLDNQPTEYYAALYDSSGELVAKSEMKVGPVRTQCTNPRLTAEQVGESYNQTIGETALWQSDKSVFHWECDHIVTRINPFGVKVADTLCRACLVAWWRGGWVPLVAGGVPTALLVDKGCDFCPTPASPVFP